MDRYIEIKSNILSPTTLREYNGVPHFRFHDLRHYQASILHAMGVPDKYIMQRGGWRTDNTLKNIYQHTFDKTTKEVSDKINDYFTDILHESNL